MYTESHQPLLSQGDDVLALEVNIAVLIFLTLVAYFYSAYFSYEKYRPKYLYLICCLVQEDELELKPTDKATITFTDQEAEIIDMEEGALEVTKRMSNVTAFNPMLEIEDLSVSSAFDPYTASPLNENTDEERTFII